MLTRLADELRSLNWLAERETSAIISRMVGNKLLPPRIRLDIIERTDGTPLFVEEMTKAVLEAGDEGAARANSRCRSLSCTGSSCKPAPLAADGRVEAGVSQALLDFDAPGAARQELLRPFYTGVLADMCRAAGRLDDGLRLAGKALELAASLDSHWRLAETHRIRGELLLVLLHPSASALV